MPMSDDFKKRLSPLLPDIVNTFGTPFHIYDEAGIKNTCDTLNTAFKAIPGFKEYFAVKALPNPTVMALVREKGFGFDCSSVPELVLARQVGARAEEIMFTSNNTSEGQFRAAMDQGGAILNLDDISLISKLPQTPDLICFRYNPGPSRTGNAIIGNPVEAKYGVSSGQIRGAYEQALKLGVKRFGIHTMLASNELNYAYMVETADMLLETVEKLHADLGIQFEFINIGGGLGIPYTPEAKAFDLGAMARGITRSFEKFKNRNGWVPRLYMESGRYITGPHGVLVTTVINHKNIYRDYVGVDASMSALMRPGMYDAYHHIHIHGKESGPINGKVDVVGALCENNDKFAVQRDLPRTERGDILVIHDTGAHGHAMGFNYNGQLRPKELLLRKDSSVDLIRRAETAADYFATLDFEPKSMKP
ncbi:diaminopimelate decarboxylase [Desulfospira joergensenii]|uniref:diaminopimelate decarboxylase n=1 Tax=Desulfospira joergensenii TaxID=53329 RepID=UPI0003B710C3|nr:diaminopimelate decarboxylase [Desulfospira joergensenii]